MGGGARGRAVRPRALLAADCGGGVGLGHLERMLALADSLTSDLEVSILVPRGDAPLERRVTDRGHRAIGAPGSTAERVAAAAAGSPPFDVVILDGYVFDVELQRRLRDSAKLTVVDDLRLPTDCDLAVNPSPGGEALWPTGAAAFLGGAAYAPIRGLFVDARERALRDGRDPRTVLVSTGATELGGIGIQVVFELLHQDETVEVVRVVGPDTPTGPMVRRPRERLLVSPPDPRGCVSDGDCICRYRWDDSAAGSVCRHSRGRHGRSRESESPGGGSRSQRMRGFCRRGRARNDVPDSPG